MRNVGLAADYVRRAKIRLGALDVLFREESWPDVVRESQEIVLALKGLLRWCGIDPPRDPRRLGRATSQRRIACRRTLAREAEALAAASPPPPQGPRTRLLRGSRTLTPSGFYSRTDAVSARDAARRTVDVVYPHVMEGEG